ncbi:MAG: DUF484 family protein [Methylococcales bacterium]
MKKDIDTDLAILESHMESMLQRVQQNSSIFWRFKAFEKKLLNLESLSEIFEHILENTKKYFDLDVISLCVIDEKDEIAAILNDAGYDLDSQNGLMLLANQELLLATFGFAAHPYIGLYKEKSCSNFFSKFDSRPTSVAITPLMRRGRYLGALCLGSYETDRFIHSMATDFVEQLVSLVAVCLENHLNFETIKRTSLIDSLTGVNNRRFFEQRITEELDRCQRSSDPLSCLFLDIDFFKRINDQYGHQAGDLVLSIVASAIKTQLRSNDVLARYGGEEFVALLSNIGEAKSIEIGERIKNTVQSLSINFEAESIQVTISIGSATYVPGGKLSGSQDIASRLIKIADSALYKAKHNGRNRVENGGVVSEF